MISKSQRQQAILRIVRDLAVRTQGELVRQLRNHGIEVNQSTVSRDIKELGLVKTPRADGAYCYSLPTDGTALAERSVRIIREFVNAVDGSASLAVVHTDRGNAQPVAEAIDRLGLDAVVGTVAGDNTLLVVLRESVGWEEFRDRLEEWLQ